MSRRDMLRSAFEMVEAYETELLRKLIRGLREIEVITVLVLLNESRFRSTSTDSCL